MPRIKAPKPSKKKHAASASSGKRKQNAADQAIIRALEELWKPHQPRARMRLRAVMRQIGLDEWKIAWLLNFKIHYLADSKHPSETKLLLDYLKEAARHLDPAPSRSAAQEAAAIEIVHDVPRPNREEPEEQ